jgi:hypothetical protein
MVFYEGANDGSYVRETHSGPILQELTAYSVAIVGNLDVVVGAARPPSRTILQ